MEAAAHERRSRGRHTSVNMRPAGIEPAACGLKDRCSLEPRRVPLTTELRARVVLSIVPGAGTPAHLSRLVAVCALDRPPRVAYLDGPAQMRERLVEGPRQLRDNRDGRAARGLGPRSYACLLATLAVGLALASPALGYGVQARLRAAAPRPRGLLGAAAARSKPRRRRPTPASGPRAAQEAVPGVPDPRTAARRVRDAGADGGRRDTDDRRRRRVRRPDRRSRPGGLRRTVRPACVHHGERLLREGQRARRSVAAARGRRRLGLGDLDRRADGARDLPGLQGGPRRGEQRRIRRPRDRRRGRRLARRDRDQQLLRRHRGTVRQVRSRPTTTTRASSSRRAPATAATKTRAWNAAGRRAARTSPRTCRTWSPSAGPA